MAQVLINEKTLSYIGDAIRASNGEDKYKDVTLVYTGVLNEPSDGKDGTTFVNQRKAYVILPNTIINHENKDKIISVEVKTEISNFSGSSYTTKILCGECMTDTTQVTDYYTMPFTGNDLIHYVNITAQVKSYLDSPSSVIPNGRSVFISLGNNNSDIVINYTVTIETTIKEPNPETNYLPSEIPNKINDIASLAVPLSALLWSGNCNYKGSSIYGYGWFLSNFKDKIITKDITSVKFMFQGSNEDSIPFDINLKNNSWINFYHMYENCDKLKQLPKINGSNINISDNLSGIFYSCYSIKTIPEDYFDFINWDSLHTSDSINCSEMFSGCYSLREIPKQICKNLWDQSASSSRNSLNNAFTCCYSLNKILDWAVTRSNGISSNCGWNTFSCCSNLSRFTFEKNEDGTAKTANMRNTTLDFTDSVGYQINTYYPETYFSTSNKMITDDTTYQALKNDIDSWTTDVNYSKYNHDSAVETINSLPDTSAYGTNTIKFRGNSGALTDGGAINTLTDAEIAIATVKGWTVTLV